MLIVHERKRKEFVILFPTVDSFVEYLKVNYSSLKFDSKIIADKINQAYNFFITTDEVVQYTRLTRNLHRGFNFKHKNITKKEFWLERGWSDEESNDIMQKDKSERAIKQSKTRSLQNKDKDVLILNGSENEFRFISGIFYSINKPICNECNSDLTLKRVNVNNISDKFYYKIIGCSSDGCKTHNMEKNDKYLSFLPSDVATKTIGDIAKNIKEKNILSIDSWIQKGYSEEDAKREIFKIQSENSKKRLNPFKPTKENLKKYGYSEEKIKEICLSPTQEKFWINKGLSKEDAIVRIRELQKSNSLKFVQKRIENHGAYSAVTETQIGYWINKGMSEENANVKLRERQSTFSLERCIEKYGEEEGQIKWKERQEKWLKNYKRNNFSKISQELFWEIYNKLPLCYRVNREIYFATLNQETKAVEEESRNNEYRLKLNKQVILPDFFVLEDKKIIEFDGVYYHRNTPENAKREDCRNEQIKLSGYEVFHVNELDYKNNKQEVINKCLNFLEIKI